MDYYENPYKTICGHIFCKKCISVYFTGKSVKKCPLCNTEIQIRSLKKFPSMSEYVTSAKNLERVALSEVNQIMSSDGPRVIEKKKLSDKTNESVNEQPKQMKRKPSNSTIIDLNRNKKPKKVNGENKENSKDQQKPQQPPISSKSGSNSTRLSFNKISKENEQSSQGIEFVAPQITPSLVEDTFHDPSTRIDADQGQNNVPEVSRLRFAATSHLRKEFQLKTIPPLKFKKEENGSHIKSKTEPISKDLITTPRNSKYFQHTSRSAPAKPLAPAIYNHEPPQPMIHNEPACGIVDNTIVFDRVENNTGTRDHVKFRLAAKLNKTLQSRLVEKTTRETSTNTETTCKTTITTAVQTDHVEAFFHIYNIDSILDKIVGFVYTQLEYSETNEFIQNWVAPDMIIDSTPPPPPPQNDITIIPDSPENMVQSMVKSFAFDRELGQSSKRKQLEFIPSTNVQNESTTVNQIKEDIVTDSPSKDNSLNKWSQQVDSSQNQELDVTLTKMIARAECVNAAKIVLENSMRLDLSTSYLMNKSVDKSINESQHEVETKKKVFEAPPGPLIISDTMTIDQKPTDNLIITDTVPLVIDQPVKSLTKPSDMVIQELIIADTVNQIDEMSQINKSFKSTINPSLAPTLILNESVSVPSPPKVTKRGLARISNARRNQSALLDSIDEILDDNTTTTDLLASNSTSSGGALELSMMSSKNETSLMKPPPAASAILGESMLMNQSTNSMNRTLSIPPVPLFQEQPSFVINTRRDENKSAPIARDSFTDSNLMLIDNICQEMYADQNCSIFDVNNLTSGGESDTTRSNQYEFACSLLDSNMKDILMKFAQSINVNFVNDITPATTHLIVNASNDQLCDTTIKYLKALSRKLWIVSMKWIAKCMNQGQLVKPDEFEIKGDKALGSHEGPTRARLRKKQLFENYEFMFVGEYGNQTISKSEIAQLAAMNGASIKTSAKDFGDNTVRVILFDEVVRPFRRDDAVTLLNNQVHCVNKSWVIDSIASFTIRPMDNYQTYDEI